MSLWQRYLFGMMSGAGSVVIKTGLNILVIPILIATMGLDAFGLYVLLIGILEVSYLLDMGAIDALIVLLGGQSPESLERKSYLKVGHLWFGALGSLFFLLGLVLLPNFTEWFHITGSLQSVAPVCLLLTLVESALMLYSCYAHSLLLTHCSHQWTNLADTLYALIANLGTLLALLSGYGLVAVFSIRLVGAILRITIMMLQAGKLEPFAFRPQVPFSKSAFQKIATLSGHAMMINFSIIVSHKIDNLVIASCLSISAVGLYELVFRFLGITIQICLKLHEGVYPLFAKMAALSQKAEARQLFLRMSSFINLVACLMIVQIVFYYREIFAIFSAGRIPIEATFPILIVAVPCVLSGVLQMPANAWLFNWGFQKYLTTTSWIAALANLVLSLILVRYFGIVGVALGTLIPQLIQHQVGLIRKACLELQISFLQYMRAVHGAILLPLLVSLLWMQWWRPLLDITSIKLIPIACTAIISSLIGGAIWFRLTATPLESKLFKEIFMVKLLQPIQLRLKAKVKTDNA